jgi:lysophospholipid acyltransferase (LPLAT)-like uncharacterized protein
VRRKSLPDVRPAILSFLASAYLRLVGLTSRIIWVNRSIREELEAAGSGFIYAFWHGRQVFLVYLHQGDRLHTMISRSRDGELIARVCRSFGLGAVRGSSSRGGSEALLEMRNILKSGGRIAFTPDGPRGPLHHVQPGVLFLAQKAGRPIVPVAYGAKRRWIFKRRWDEFLIPKPLNRLAMVYGEPIHVKPADDLEQKAAELKIALDDVASKADIIAGTGCCN